MDYPELYYIYASISFFPHEPIRVQFVLNFTCMSPFDIFICLSKLLRSLVAMDPYYKSCAEIDLTSLHYVTFIKPLFVLPTEPCPSTWKCLRTTLSSWLKQKKTFSCSPKNISSLLFWCTKKFMLLNSKNCHMKFWSSSHKCKVSA
jgi:hypothetical protein